MFNVKSWDGLKIKEGHLSQKSIRRMKFATAMAAFSFPLIIFQSYLPDELIYNGVSGAVFMGVLIFLAICFLVSLTFVFANPFIMRLSFPGKYLDEWEIQKSQDAKSFALCWMSVLMLIAVFTLFIIPDFIGGITVKTGFIEDIFWTLFWLIITLPMLHFIWNLTPLNSDEA